VLLVLVLSASLFLGKHRPSPRQASIGFPRGMRPAEQEREFRRATLVLPPRAARAQLKAGGEPRRRDPFLLALPVKPGRPVVIVEANALRHSRIGEGLLACWRLRGLGELDEVSRLTGIDPLKDIDRVAFLGDALVVSGFFDRARFESLGPPEPYGSSGRIYSQGGVYLGEWSDEVLVLSSRAEDVRQAIDQLEGRAPVLESGIPEEMAYGEVYGVLPGSAGRALLGALDGDLAARLATLARTIELHVDAMEDVAAVVRVRGEDAAGLSELAGSIESALSLVRVKAQVGGDEQMAALLGSAEVEPGEGTFSIELALPADRLEDWFGGCGNRPETAAP